MYLQSGGLLLDPGSTGSTPLFSSQKKMQIESGCPKRRTAGGFTIAWKKKVRQLQVPAFATNTKAAWVLRFDDILADALELGLLQNHEVVLSQPVIDQLKEATPKGIPDGLLPMLMQYYLANKHGDEEWVILPVSAVDSYLGNNNFSKKWKQQLPKSIFESKEAYGICKFKMTL